MAGEFARVPQHDEKCCMEGAWPGWGPHPDCPGHYGWKADGRGGMVLDWADPPGTMSCAHHGDVPYEHICRRPDESVAETTARALGEARDV